MPHPVDTVVRSNSKPDTKLIMSCTRCTLIKCWGTAVLKTVYNIVILSLSLTKILELYYEANVDLHHTAFLIFLFKTNFHLIHRTPKLSHVDYIYSVARMNR